MESRAAIKAYTDNKGNLHRTIEEAEYSDFQNDLYDLYLKHASKSNYYSTGITMGGLLRASKELEELFSRYKHIIREAQNNPKLKWKFI